MEQWLIDKWDQALRSGRYEQTEGAMRKGDYRGNIGYCCLGVLKDISGCTWKQATAEEDGGKFSLIDTDSVTRDHEIFFPADYDDANRDRLPDNHFTYPSDDDLEEWGLSWSHARALAEMNDTGSSFSEIADCIQEILTSSDEQAETAQTE